MRESCDEGGARAVRSTHARRSATQKGAGEAARRQQCTHTEATQGMGCGLGTHEFDAREGMRLLLVAPAGSSAACGLRYILFLISSDDAAAVLTLFYFEDDF